uniref:Uncharacterized protein n=2 Tax=Clostridium haemolyticum TaxID=84025 RepID=A0ABR4TCE0_CLOHA|nr:hypothetical protein Z960_p0112 [Clostridium haemolyticum NCTC 9693]
MYNKTKEHIRRDCHMNHRILSCSTFIENYYICLNKQIVGFSTHTGETGDIIFLSVKTKKSTMCGARAIIQQETDIKPWENGEKYVQCFKISNIEYCTPFDLSILKRFSEKGWGLKFILGSNKIKEQEAIDLLNSTFEKNKRDSMYIFKEDELKKPRKKKENNICDVVKEEISSTVQAKDKDNKISNQTNITQTEQNTQLDIMGTFQTINFISEQHEVQGLETLVTKHFYNLFTKYNVDNSILISDNRKFSTATIKDDNGTNINGISGIPDALLITYKKDDSVPLQISLIEYECYGQQKTSIRQKSDYLNCHIIPQLMRFASTFSIVTDYKIRENTIKSWVSKISNYIYNDNELTKRTSKWIKELYPDINEMQIALRFNEILKEAFENSIKIVLIIDELTNEQKDTIKNIIGAFKLNNNSKNNSIEFASYVVRLEQKVNIVDDNAQYALSYQE